MVSVLIVTEFYNEIENISGLIDTVFNQDLIPDEWLLIDDGSTDGSARKFMGILGMYHFPRELITMPEKDNPSANMKGIAFKEIYVLNDAVLGQRFDYLFKIDADTRLPTDLLKTMVNHMEYYKHIGVMSPQMKGEPLRKRPMGTAKLVRWNVVEATSLNYWDLDPDALWNIKALKLGLTLEFIDKEVSCTRPTQLLAKQGRYQMGQRMYYVRCSKVLVFYRFLKSVFRRRHGIAFLKGYLHELRKRDWKNTDPDVKHFYSLGYAIRKRLWGKTW